MKKFPKTLYVSRENESTRDEFLNNVTDAKDLAEVGQDKPVAVYTLQNTVIVRGKVEIVPIRRKKVVSAHQKERYSKVKNGQYESRKEQIERGFMRELRRDLKSMVLY